jgi:hypothetical protein
MMKLIYRKYYYKVIPIEPTIYAANNNNESLKEITLRYVIAN